EQTHVLAMVGHNPSLGRLARLLDDGTGDAAAITDLANGYPTSGVAVFSVEGPTAPGKDPWGSTRIGLSATTKISRKDFGLTWNAALETGGILVGDEVTIMLDVQFVKA
ncbi:MAG: YceI family protein, partial [Terriglobales bacterium]